MKLLSHSALPAGWIVAAGVCLLSLTSAAAAADKARPNILLIVGDDMGYADVGFQNCKDIPTPNLDRLAADGVRFTNGYVSAPYCSPTRAGLLTGRYQERFGHEFNPSGPNGLPLTETTIADRLKAAGYATGLVGKWHLGSRPEMEPQKRGFDEFFGFLGGAHSYFSSAGILRGTTPVKELDYTTDAFGREAVAFIRNHKDQPWFLYLAFNAVHTPMHATDDRLAKFPAIADKQRRTYDAMMLALDDSVGAVRKELDQDHLANNTLIFFISDNGGPTMRGTTINGSRNTPLRGSKRTTLEGGIRVPFLMAWPDHVKPGVYEKPVIQLDATATALAVAGVKADRPDGVNLLPFVSGEQTAAPHDTLYWRFGDQMAIRMGDYKLVRYDRRADGNAGGAADGGGVGGGANSGQGRGRKRQGIATGPKLYNLANDIGETKDLKASEPQKLRELQAKWDAWNATLVKPLWGNDGRDNDGPEPGAAPPRAGGKSQ